MEDDFEPVDEGCEDGENCANEEGVLDDTPLDDDITSQEHGDVLALAPVLVPTSKKRGHAKISDFFTGGHSFKPLNLREFGLTTGSNNTQEISSKRKKRTERSVGTEEKVQIDKISIEIKGLESQIEVNAQKYEESRQILAMGVFSIIAKEQVTKMDQCMEKLTLLKKQRAEAIENKNVHLLGVINGDVRETALEEVREMRAKLKRLHPHDVSRSETEDLSLHMDKTGRSFKDVNRTNQDKCPGKCKSLITDLRRNVYVCTDCKFVYEMPKEQVLVGPMQYMSTETSGYKPLGHLCEIISHFQGNKRVTAPEDIINKIKRFCTRYKYKKHEIAPKVVRMFLKRMQQDENNRHRHEMIKNKRDKLKRYTDHYKQATEISHRLSGIPPPYLTPMQEDNILNLFPYVIAAYKTSPRYKKRLANREGRIKPTPNNPNYLLIFFKECQLLGYDELLPYISLPKNPENIFDNDTMAWKHICTTYGWPYIPTI